MTRQPRILVIDDEDSIRESLRAYLEDFDYQVDSADSAEEAMLLLQQRPYDLAIVDMRLPGESGDVFIIKARALFKGMQFVIHTGSVEFKLTDELMRLGVDPRYVYVKPLHDLSVLVKGVRELLHETP